MCVKDTGTKYQLWISDFNIDGTFTRIHPFIVSSKLTNKIGIVVPIGNYLSQYFANLY
jgi:hypothetical protein